MKKSNPLWRRQRLVVAAVLAAGTGYGCGAPGDAPGGALGTGGHGGASQSGGSTGDGGRGGSGGESAGASGTGGGAGATMGSGGATDSDGGETAGGTDAGSTEGTGGAPPGPVMGLGPWTGKDNVAASQKPPGGLAANQVPMFVSIGFDDNQSAGGMNGLTGMFRELVNPKGSGQAETFDGAPVRATFYMTSTYGSNGSVLASWQTAFKDGHEIGDHTVTHPHGLHSSESQWQSQIKGCFDFLTSKVKVPAAEVIGFRAPFLEYNAATFTVLSSLGFHYDCSIEDGYQPEMDGTNYMWPYTLDNGSPGYEIILMDPDLQYAPIGKYPGLWEMPDHPVIVPPDEECAKYGVPSGLRAKIKARVDYFGIEDGKMTGLDFNMWDEFKMSEAEFLATLKYTLDLRLKGNRAPFMFGGHSVYYGGGGKLSVLTEFVKYAISKPEVRFVPLSKILDWVRNPAALH
jgi:Polysaccharide deacetylase